MLVHYIPLGPKGLLTFIISPLPFKEVFAPYEVDWKPEKPRGMNKGYALPPSDKGNLDVALPKRPMIKDKGDGLKMGPQNHGSSLRGTPPGSQAADVELPDCVVKAPCPDPPEGPPEAYRYTGNILEPVVCGLVKQGST